MKTKGITFWERHVEHFVLGLAALVLLGFAAMQFIGNPNAVESRGQTISPGEIDGLLVEKAEKISEGLDPAAESPVDISNPDSSADDFESRLTNGITREAELFAFMPPGGPPIGGADGSKGGIFSEPEIAAPYLVAGEQYFDALIPEVVAEYEDLATRFEDDSLDLTWITPVAVFSIGDALREFQKSDAATRRDPIPERWYRSRITVLDVRIEREEYADGAWGNPIVLETIPGQYSIRDRMEGKIDAEGGERLEQQVSDPALQGQIVQPEFYATRQNAWSPPDPRIVDEALDNNDEEQQEIFRLRLKLKRDTAERDRLQANLDERCRDVAKPAEPPAQPGGRTGGGGAGGGGGRQAPGRPGGGLGGGIGGGGGGNPMGRNTGNTRGGAQASRTLCDQWQRKLRIIERRIESTGMALQELVGAPEMAGGGADGGDLMAAEELLVWGHDLDVLPGRTYRYRFTVEIYNPFFARKINLRDEQDHLADSFSMNSRKSEWSEGIEVQPPLRVFITRANGPKPDRRRGQGPDLGAASAEVFRFFDGRWWSYRFTVEPGERIGGVKDFPPPGNEGGEDVTVDFGTSWFVLDIVPDSGRGSLNAESALVMLQQARTGEMTGYLDPRRETRDPDLLDLRNQVEVAESESG